MISLFTKSECDDFIQKYENNETLEIYKNKAKEIVLDFFKSNNITLSRPDFMIVLINKSSTLEGKKWHYDDVDVINFIIMIKGEGTHILHNNNIIQLTPGYGYITIGIEGYNFMSMKPTLHKAPETDENRLILKVILDGDFNFEKYFCGPNICGYETPLYNERRNNIKSMFEEDLNILKNL